MTQLARLAVVSRGPFGLRAGPRIVQREIGDVAPLGTLYETSSFRLLLRILPAPTGSARPSKPSGWTPRRLRSRSPR
jgi:hypothetical protein